ncbi:hypothetical protein LTR53_014485 [Teratosphaeriaceae sp. CCFEE 6253]|nr:hypothetical protein LTR53_014485 [Teratosphaeriaceae sp. CCFEE 6253]
MFSNLPRRTTENGDPFYVEYNPNRSNFPKLVAPPRVYTLYGGEMFDLLFKYRPGIMDGGKVPNGSAFEWQRPPNTDETSDPPIRVSYKNTETDKTLFYVDRMIDVNFGILTLLSHIDYNRLLDTYIAFLN